jgi:stalled ribosome rescue protein Dom34
MRKSGRERERKEGRKKERKKVSAHKENCDSKHERLRISSRVAEVPGRRGGKGKCSYQTT